MAAWGATAALAQSQGSLGPTGDAVRGRELFIAREGGHCVRCHALAGIEPAGDVGPSLNSIGSRMSAGEIRYRIVDISRLKPQAAMPSFHRTGNLTRVAPAYAGKPILGAQQVEDIVAFLGTLK
jgi:sulfur-oxidizing protein SoxX